MFPPQLLPKNKTIFLKSYDVINPLKTAIYNILQNMFQQEKYFLNF